MQSAQEGVDGPAELTITRFLPNVLDEKAVEALDTASATKPLNVDLLSTTPVADMRKKIEAIVSLLQRVDHRRLLSSQGMLARLTGANLEARLEFELAAQKVLASVSELHQLAEEGKRISLLLKQLLEDISREQKRLEIVIAEAKDLLKRSDNNDTFTTSRFERRLTNIIAIHAANCSTIQQTILADKTLQSMLDRVMDVETLLVPLWQRNVLALAHASVGEELRENAGNLAQVHNSLIQYLA